MDISEKARIRIEHWLKHNDNHLREYEAFAHELESAAKNESPGISVKWRRWWHRAMNICARP